jgi:hypothetical protein
MTGQSWLGLHRDETRSGAGPQGVGQNLLFAEDHQSSIAYRPKMIETSQRSKKIAHGIAKAASACAEAGNISKAIEIALDVEQLICEVNTFLNAASLMHRISKS